MTLRHRLLPLALVLGLGACGPVPSAGSPLGAGSAIVPAANASAAAIQAASNNPASTFEPSARIIASIPISGNPNGLLSAFGSIWVASRHEDALYRIDPARNAVVDTIGVGAEPSYLATDGKAVWTVLAGADAVASVDPTSRSVETVQLGPAEFDSPSLVAGGGWIWAATEDPAVVKINPTTHLVVGRISLPGRANDESSEPELAYAGGLLWVARRLGSGDINGIRRYDPATLRLVDTLLTSRTPLLFPLGDAGSIVWASDSGTPLRGGPLLALDAITGRVIRELALPAPFSGAVLSNGHLWVTEQLPDGYASMDPSTGRVGNVQTLSDLPAEFDDFLDLGAHELWISDWTTDMVYRVDPAP